MAFRSTNASFAHEAFEVSQQAARLAVTTATDPDTIVMTGVVLTAPLPLSNSDIRNFTGENPASNGTSTPTNNRIGRFLFKVRLIPKGGFSPHEYLTDPCKLSTATDSNFQCIIDLIALHTTAISVGGYVGNRPKIGDMVEIELQKLTRGRGFWYNTQTGTFKSIIDGSTRSTPALQQLSIDCQSLGAAFENQDITSVDPGSVTDPSGRYTPQTGTYLPDNLAITNGGLQAADLIVTATGGHVTRPRVLRDVVEDWNNLAAAFNAHFETQGWKLGGWGDRTFQRQLELKEETPSLAARPGTSNHGWGVAVDTHYYNTNDVRQSFTWGGEAFLWMTANARTYNWEHPSWAQENGSKPEAWHWESTKRNQLVSVS